MKTKLIKLTCGLALLGAAATAPAQSTLLYDNGAINGSINAWPIANGNHVANTFTLSSDATLTSATIGAWILSADTLTSLDWSITTTAFAEGGSTLASGPATISSSTLFGSVGSYNIYSESFSISPTVLDAGTYWFQLDNAVTVNSGPVYWDENDGPSTAAHFADISAMGSESFQLYGTAAPAPEPTTLALAGLGGLGILWQLRRRK